MAANPNTIPLQTTWTKEYQVSHWKIPVYPAITNYRLAPDLEKGDSVKRTYSRQFVANATGGDGGFTRQVIVDTEETLDIDQEYDTSFYIKELDEIQDHLPVRQRYAKLSAVALHQQIDANVLGLYASFTSALDNASFGGSSGDGITVTPTNVPKLFSSVSTLLQRSNVMINVPVKFTAVKADDGGNGMPVAVISPDVYSNITQRVEGKDTAQGDNVSTNGYIGKFFGYNIFVSNALSWTGTLALSVNPTDGDTVTIMGVVFTFKDTVDAGTTAGQVEIGSTVDLTRANLTALINAPGTTVADGSDLGKNALSNTPDAAGFSDRDRFKNVTATNSNSLDTMTIVAKGKGYVPVSSSFTSGSNSFTANLSIQHCLIGVEGAIDLVVRVAPKLRTQPRDGYIGTDVITWTAWGSKVFTDGKVMMVDVKVCTSAYSGEDGN